MLLRTHILQKPVVGCPWKVVRRNVHATIPRGNMGYDQYAVPGTVAVESFIVAFYIKFGIFYQNWLGWNGGNNSQNRWMHISWTPEAICQTATLLASWSVSWNADGSSVVLSYETSWNPFLAWVRALSQVLPQGCVRRNCVFFISHSLAKNLFPRQAINKNSY